MTYLDTLIESFLTESVALTKGSQRVMNDKKLVADLADSIRDDARSHPQNFPSGASRSFQKAQDEELAKWFLENLDKIEKEGYEGTVYSRDGVNSEWIVRRYIAGSHNWEDLTGVMNMNLRDWYLLKNRNLLEPGHRDIPKFNSVRDIGYYTTTHYKKELEDAREAAKNAARNKMSKSVKLIDNDQYRIYTTLNRAAACALGLGTQWCTANSNYGGHFHNYANKAMLFQMFPYTGEKDEEGKKIIDKNESYQFDAGGPNFMNQLDVRPNPENIIDKYPYIYSDLVHSLRQNKGKLEKAFDELSADPTLQGEDYKIKTYSIDDEIQKLQKLIDRGYFTDQERPSKKEKDNSAQQQDQISQTAPPAEQEVREETTGDTLNHYFGQLANYLERKVERSRYKSSSNDDYDSSYHNLFRSDIKLTPIYKQYCDAIVSELKDSNNLTAKKVHQYVQKYANDHYIDLDKKALKIITVSVMNELELKGVKILDKNSLKEELSKVVDELLNEDLRHDTNVQIPKIAPIINKQSPDKEIVDLFNRLNARNI